MEIITKFKIFEIKNDLDPYDEEDWEDNNNLYVIYVVGQDSHFLAKKKERIINDRQGNWKDYYYVVANNNFDDEFELLSDFLVHRELTILKSIKDVLEALMDSTFYLNEIHKNLYNSKYSENDEVFYFVRNGNEISFKNRELELKEREIHKDVDPYCEEEWTK